MTHPVQDCNLYHVHAGKTCVVAFNPATKCWHVYLDPENPTRALCTVERIELHSVGNFGRTFPPYAPNGTPTFLGVIVDRQILDPVKDRGTLTRLYEHQTVPGHVFAPGDQDFDRCRRILLDGSSMLADMRRQKG